MKLFNQLLSKAVLTASLCSVPAFAEVNCNLEPILDLENHCGLLYVNKRNEMLFLRRVVGVDIVLYKNIELGGEELNLSELTGEQLLQLGYSPKSFSSIGKPWEGKYSLDYAIRIVTPSRCSPIDDFGNVLLMFTSEENHIKNVNTDKWLYKLGVWNKDYGFKVIETPGIENVSYETYSNKEYLFVHGNKVLVIPIKDGYWGERRQQQEEAMEEKPVDKKPTWWDENKPSWWPS